MVRPAHFGSNPETAGSNAFQGDQGDARLALHEFDSFQAALVDAGVDVLVVEDDGETVRPDAVFPNNWLATLEGGTVLLFPMLSPNRRTERRLDIVAALNEEFLVSRVVDFSRYEEEGQFLEGTGSLVLDRQARIAYACLSPRTSGPLVRLFCESCGFEPVMFDASVDGLPVYHTNVILTIGAGFVLACLEAVSDPSDRHSLIESLSHDRQVIDLTVAQVKEFAGNALQVRAKDGSHVTILSARALAALTSNQKEVLQSFGKIVTSDLTTIENLSGGSARCMLAEVFLSRRV
ncbi:MAG: amidinotransferase [Armatimonadetes bacterium]|nr:amidinotransferase [Armatimonadota bacterium]